VKWITPTYDQGGFRVIFARSPLPANEGLNGGINGGINVPRNVPTKDRVLSLIERHPGIQRKVIAQILNITEKTVSRHLATITNEGLAKHLGSKKTGGYYPTKP
jgi:predicted HTH transcriptional regulator